MNKSLKNREELCIYLFTSIQHFKRAYKFLTYKNYKKANLIILFIKKEKNLELIKSKIKNINNSFLKISFIHFSNFFHPYSNNNLFKKIKGISQNKNLNIIVDRLSSAAEIKITGKLLKSENFKIIFIEHNLNFHWEYIFTHKSGYQEKNLFNLIFSRNSYRIIFRSYFSKLIFRILERKINIFELMKIGILNFADEVYVYDQKSLKYIQNIKSISKIKKEIIDYEYEFLPKKPIFNNFYNICIFSAGSFKTNDKNIMNKQLKALKFIVDFLKEKFSKNNIKITIKFKEGEIINFPNIDQEFDKNITFLDNIDDQRENFHLVVVPIDSFVLIEYLRSDVLVYCYNIYENLGAIGKIAINNKKIPVKLSF